MSKGLSVVLRYIGKSAWICLRILFLSWAFLVIFLETTTQARLFIAWPGIYIICRTSLRLRLPMRKIFNMSFSLCNLNSLANTFNKLKGYALPAFVPSGF